MLEKLREFRDTLSERIKSPFIGSLIIAWSFFHWKIYILLFYNQDGVGLDERIALISRYIEKKNQYDLIWRPILAALIALIFYNLLNAIGLIIKLIYDNWVSPYIQKVFFNKNIIEKSKYLTTLKAFQRVKEELLNKEETYRASEDKLVTMEGNFSHYRSNSIPTLYKGPSEIFEAGFWWSNNYIFPNSDIQKKVRFKGDFQGIKLESGEIVQINNAMESEDSHILVFDKHFADGRILKNHLVKDKKGNYYGTEADEVIISYIKLDKLD